MAVCEKIDTFSSICNGQIIIVSSVLMKLQFAYLTIACGLLANTSTSAAQLIPDAHAASRMFIIDPTYNAQGLSPAPDAKMDAAPWIYGDGQLEAWVIDSVVTDGFATNKHVDYKRNYARFSSRVSFRHAWPIAAVSSLTLRASGAVTVLVDGKSVFRSPATERPQTVILPANVRRGDLQIDIESDQAPPALLVQAGPFATGAGWEVSLDGSVWTSASAFAQTKSGVMPHERAEPNVSLRPVRKVDGIYDFGVTILGRPIFRFTGSGVPKIMTGESLPESKGNETQAESRMDVKKLPDGRWTSLHALGFRYLRIDGGTASDIVTEATFHPVCYRGAFACSDEKLNRIWMNSAYTLRLCMQRLMVDGPKRDRMPWVGDQASNLIANAYTFAAGDIIRESLTALGRPTGGYINSIVDYSLWWVINNAQYQRYFDDPAYLRRELPHINDLLGKMSSEAGEDGVLRPSQPHAWVFIDWGVNKDKGKTLTALQMMWYWAQRSGAELAKKADDEAMAAKWGSRADALAALLRERAWDTQQQAWKEYFETPGAGSPYPNFLAVLSGLSGPGDYPEIVKALAAHPQVGTPFMNGFFLMAEVKAGAPVGGILDRIRQYWGGMLDLGATTFWEDFKPGEKRPYAMYNRPFARSLSHAWSSGPAAILPQSVLGARPLSDGWKTFVVAPQLGDLKWAIATVPTPSGDIQIAANPIKTLVSIPAGLSLVDRGKSYVGPRVVVLSTLRTSR